MFNERITRDIRDHCIRQQKYNMFFNSTFPGVKSMKADRRTQNLQWFQVLERYYSGADNLISELFLYWKKKVPKEKIYEMVYFYPETLLKMGGAK